jgi:NAD-specific glutamate dehydrogenase
MWQNRRFDENYGLAATQSLKNKDIPEGGAKGTILPSCVDIYSNNISSFNALHLLGFTRIREYALRNMWM